MHAYDGLLNVLYPPTCVLCRIKLPAPQPSGENRSASPARTDRSTLLCEPCLLAMPRSGPPTCSRCGVEVPGAFDAVIECLRCRTGPPVFDAARAPWQYAGPAQEAVRQFKYHRRWRVGRWLAEEMTTTARAAFPLEDITVVLPIPRHWLKRRLSGMDPADRLARVVAGSLLKPYQPRWLRRARWTTTQTHLSWRRRARNVQRAFAAHGRVLLGHTVLLVDDVLTSGATANACAAALKEAGASKVFVLTAARTPLNHDQ